MRLRMTEALKRCIYVEMLASWPEVSSTNPANYWSPFVYLA
jgi:hypothetical protein